MVTGPLDCQTRTTFEKGWPMHATFGAPCDNRSFHTKLIWEVRQNRHMYEAAAAMTGERCLWVDINRSIMKLPGKGDNEFLHWDYDIFSDNPLATIGPATIQGKIMYTVGDFVCVPGSHTEQFKQQFRHEYDALYPNRKKNASKFGLQNGVADPMGLVGRKHTVPVPAGCAVFWSPLLLHGHSKNPMRSPVQYGMYVGYQKASIRPEYSARASAPTNELEDRIGSYTEGRAPLLWPSLDDIHYYPKKFRNFPEHLVKIVGRMHPDDPRITTRTLQKDGKVVLHLVDVVDPEYQAPELTELGKKLLGIIQYGVEDTRLHRHLIECKDPYRYEVRVDVNSPAGAEARKALAEDKRREKHMQEHKAKHKAFMLKKWGYKMED